METKERLKVYIDYQRGKVSCICLRENPGCKRHRNRCTADIVERDKFRDWEQTFKRNRYGK